MNMRNLIRHLRENMDCEFHAQQFFPLNSLVQFLTKHYYYIMCIYVVIPEVRVEVISNNNTENKTVILICNIVRGNPMDYSYEWTFNGTELNSNNSRLILINLTIEQTGTYFCSVTNEVGTGTGNTTVVYIGIGNGKVKSEKESEYIYTIESLNYT